MHKVGNSSDSGAGQIYARLHKLCAEAGRSDLLDDFLGCDGTKMLCERNVVIGWHGLEARARWVQTL